MGKKHIMSLIVHNISTTKTITLDVKYMKKFYEYNKGLEVTLFP